jgi:chlorophyllide a reductase subunit Z
VLPWDAAATSRLHELAEAEPVLVRISAARRLRERAERVARERGDEVVTREHVEPALA